MTRRAIDAQIVTPCPTCHGFVEDHPNGCSTVTAPRSLAAAHALDPWRIGDLLAEALPDLIRTFAPARHRRIATLAANAGASIYARARAKRR